MTVIPLLVLLYTLDQRGVLGEDPMTSTGDPGADIDAGRRPGTRAQPGELAAASGAQAGSDQPAAQPAAESTPTTDAAQPATEREPRRTGAHRASRRR